MLELEGHAATARGSARGERWRGGIWLTLALAVCCAGSLCGCEPESTADERLVVAFSDGNGVDEAYIRDSVQTLGSLQRASLADRDLFESYLKDVAGLRVLAQRAEAELLAGDPSLQNRVQLAGERVLAEALIDAEITRRVPVTEADLRSFFDDNAQSFRRSARVRFRQVLVRRREVAEEVAERLRAGEPFEDIAREYSVHPSAERGGAMGWHEVDRLEPALQTVLTSLAAGERSAVVETAFGLHVVEVQERVEAEVVPFESVRDSVERRMRTVRRREVAGKLLEEIWEARGIRLEPDRVEALHAGMKTTHPPEAGDASAARASGG